MAKSIEGEGYAHLDGTPRRPGRIALISVEMRHQRLLPGELHRARRRVGARRGRHRLGSLPRDFRFWRRRRFGGDRTRSTELASPDAARASSTGLSGFSLRANSASSASVRAIFGSLLSFASEAATEGAAAAASSASGPGGASGASMTGGAAGSSEISIAGAPVASSSSSGLLASNAAVKAVMCSNRAAAIATLHKRRLDLNP